MRVRMLTLSAGPAGVVQPGAVVEVSDEEGRALIAGRYAELVEVPIKAAVPVETATLEGAPEAAVARRGRPRGREA